MNFNFIRQGTHKAWSFKKPKFKIFSGELVRIVGYPTKAKSTSTHCFCNMLEAPQSPGQVLGHAHEMHRAIEVSEPFRTTPVWSAAHEIV